MCGGLAIPHNSVAMPVRTLYRTLYVGFDP